MKAVDGVNNSGVSQIAVTDAAPLSGVVVAAETSWSVGDALAATPTATGGNPSGYVWSISGTPPTGVGQNAASGALSDT
jgi:hypothetical protein